MRRIIFVARPSCCLNYTLHLAEATLVSSATRRPCAPSLIGFDVVHGLMGVDEFYSTFAVVPADTRFLIDHASPGESILITVRRSAP